MKIPVTCIALFYSLHVYSQQSFTVYFDFNKSTPDKAGRARLDSFVKAEMPNLSRYTFDLTGHCDGIGSDRYNDKLSLQRVATIKKYLRGKGIGEQFIGIEKGLGKRQPVNDNADKDERLLNRRVEIRYHEINTPGMIRISSTLKEQIADSTVKAGTSIVLKNINFIGGLSKFHQASVPVLEELLEVMRSNPGLVIRIEGHICCIADNKDGIDLETGLNNLSFARARAVMNYLIENNVPQERVSYTGFGHSLPLYPYPEKTEEEKTANRRVEIRITRK